MTTKTPCDVLIRNGRVLTMDASRTIFSPGAVAIHGSRIVDVGADREVTARVDAEKVVDAAGGIVHPGFIDAHNHIVHTSCRGIFNGIHNTGAAPVNFATWKADVSDADEAAATEMASLEMLRSGFTMFIEPGSLFSTAAAAEAVERVGLRALFAPIYLWDRGEPFEAIPALESPNLMARAPIDHDRCLQQLDAELYRNRDQDALVRGYLFVYGEGTGSPELFQAAHACARENGVPLHLHAGYLPAGAELYRSLNGTSQLVDLHQAGVLDENTVIVHANALDAAEEAVVRECGCQIVWCPAAYLSLGISGAVPFKMAERYRAGVRIALGADGAFDGPPSETMRAARFVSQTYADPILPETLLEMQTIQAAAAAGMESELGSLEAGKRADIVLRSTAAAEGYPDNNLCHVLALTMGPGSVRMVLVNGETVFDGGRSTRVDEQEAYRKVSLSVQERAHRLGIDPGPAWPVIGAPPTTD